MLKGGGGKFWEGGVDSGRVAHVNLLKKGVYSKREWWIPGASGNIIVVQKGSAYFGREG